MLVKNIFTHWTRQVFSPGTVMRGKYDAFKSLSECDKRAHELMAQIEEIHHDRKVVDFTVVASIYNELSRRVGDIVDNLLRMDPYRYAGLKPVFRRLDAYVRFMLPPPAAAPSPPYTLTLEKVADDHLPLVGGKALNLAVLNRTLGLPTPPGFVITTRACRRLIDHNDLRDTIDRRLTIIDTGDSAGLNRASAELTGMIDGARVPPELERSALDAYRAVFGDRPRPPMVAVRSSAVAEDGRSSFAGQYRTVLNVDRNGILAAYKAVVASKYTPQALVYRLNSGLTDAETPMAGLVMEMIDATASGVMVTSGLDPGSADLLEVHSIWGLGELLVRGEVTPDVFRIRKGARPAIVSRSAGRKSHRMVPDPQGRTRVVPAAGTDAARFSLDRTAVLALARWGMRLEAHHDEPREIEWCSGPSGALLLLQCRPLNTADTTEPAPECRAPAVSHTVLIDRGERAAGGAASGRVFIVGRKSDLDAVPRDAVLVTRYAASYIVRAMDRIKAVVTDVGSSAGHLASVAREFGVPALFDTGSATRKLAGGRRVTVDADARKVYDGVVSALENNPCTGKNLTTGSPFERRLEYVVRFVSPLRLRDPDHRSFTPEGCRSLHDIVRFAHEKGVREMFEIGNRRTGRRMGARKLDTRLPIRVYILDVGSDPAEGADRKTVRPEAITSRPWQAVWRGLTHPDIQWSAFTHFNWEEYDRIVMQGGIISAESAQLASYAVVARSYLNLNLKFGYHFVILDAICGQNSDGNHILFRFSGGGAEAHGRSLRAAFLCRVLESFGFQVEQKSDLVDATLHAAGHNSALETLDGIGRLLGATRLMDMYLKEESQVAPCVDDFLSGRYNFSSVAMDD